MKCFYHSADLDGHCSGAIIKFFYPKCELFPINYGQDFPWDKITNPNEIVFMVDFSLQPFDGMLRLRELCDLVWIDHHKTAMDDYEKAQLTFPGKRQDGIGACFLVWTYMSNDPVPRAIKLLAEYDVWNHSDSMTLAFQYGMRLKETWPEKSMELWKDLFTGGPDACEVIATAGATVLEYEAQTNAKFCKAYAFETMMPVYPNIGEIPPPAYRAICVNKGFTNSKVFDSIWNPEKYDLMIAFCRLPLSKKQWTVSLYSDKPEVDCGTIAKNFGGGGHKGAAGFQCYELPFAI